MKKNAFLKKVLGLSAIGLVGSSLALTAISCSSSEKQDAWDKENIAITKINQDTKVPHTLLRLFAIYDDTGTKDVTSKFTSETGLSLNPITGRISGTIPSTYDQTVTYTMHCNVWYHNQDTVVSQKFTIKPSNSNSLLNNNTNIQNGELKFADGSISDIVYSSGEDTPCSSSSLYNDIVTTDGKNICAPLHECDDIDQALANVEDKEFYTNNKLRWDIMLASAASFLDMPSSDFEKWSLELSEFDRKSTGEIKFKITAKITPKGQQEQTSSIFTVSDKDSKDIGYTKIVNLSMPQETGDYAYGIEWARSNPDPVDPAENPTKLPISSNFICIK